MDEQKNINLENDTNEDKFVLKFDETAFEDFGEMNVSKKPAKKSKPKNAQPKKAKNAKKPKKEKKKNTVWGVLLRFVIIIAIFVGITYASKAIMNATWDIFGLYQEGEIQTIEIAADAPVSEIANTLAEAGVIDYPKVFEMYAKYRNPDMEFNFGNDFKVHRSMSYADVLALIVKSSLQTATVTIPEGYSISAIATLLEQNGVCKSKDLIEEMKTGDFSDYEFITALDETENLESRVYRFEGYMFPDTYEFYVNADPEGVIKKFLNNFEVKMDEEIMAKVESSGYTLDEIVTLASIVQKEAFSYSEMQTVASVYFNRLDKPSDFPQLESEAVGKYVEKTLRPFGATQAQIDAYDTTICEGLPLSAIGNPGVLAIKAVLKADNTNYYYFVSTNDTKHFYYAKTLSKHEENCAKVEKYNEESAAAEEAE